MSAAAAAAKAAGEPDEEDAVVTRLPTPGDNAQVPDKLYFRIGEVASMVGVDAHVLRYWESEFRMKPHRSGSGQRLYRKQDVARFLRVKNLLHDEGYTIAGARKVLSGGTQVDAANPDRVRDALKRLADLQAHLLEIRDELGPDGVI